MNNSEGPENDSGTWWSIIKGYEDLQGESYKAQYVVVEEIINSIDNEEISDLLTEMLEIWDGDNLHITASGGFTSGGSTVFPGTHNEGNKKSGSKLTPAELAKVERLSALIRSGGTMTIEENEEYERLVSLDGFAVQKPQNVKLLMFAVRTPNGRYSTKPTHFSLDKKGDDVFSLTTEAEFIKDLKEVIDNA
tara:strand:+ start:1637 stop:2212 length:576 start_codon:yes stop_codon:yes gene_type:complete